MHCTAHPVECTATGLCQPVTTDLPSPSSVGSASASTPQDVARVLALLGISYVMKAVSEDGLFAFNLALPDRYAGIPACL